MLKFLLNGMNNLIFPPNCVLCHRRLSNSDITHNLCHPCQSLLLKNKPPFCSKCSIHLQDPTQTVCLHCQKTKPHFDTAWAALRYNKAMRTLIHLFKYGNKSALRYPFSRSIFAFLKSYHVELKEFDVVTPIPLHPTRLRERGYNQSELLAKMITRGASLPLSTQNLIRTRHTRFQASVSQKERWTNIQGAFKIKHPAEFSRKSVLMVDDLITTGATASEAARILKEAGAQKVGVVTLAVANSIV